MVAIITEHSRPKEFCIFSPRVLVGLPTAFGLLVLALTALSETYPLIVRGKVTMKDGARPPKSLGIQRTCSDVQGSAPGPVTGKNGEYVWRMDVDPMRTRRCWLQAELAGFVSSRIEISNLNGYTSTTIDEDNLPEAEKQLQAVVEASPKFARG